MVDVDGIVDVDGVEEYVREPRLPALRPPPGRASAPDTKSPAVAATTASMVKARNIVRNIKPSHMRPDQEPEPTAR
jgi:hypothetical protein